MACLLGWGEGRRSETVLAARDASSLEVDFGIGFHAAASLLSRTAPVTASSPS